ncbi:hypothetical protein OE749_03755 [Aestuariibacter sp. AA17]|uniref:Uncharacterized protein n=1 Tax=Fluctibacter corallii TaxID=2984329 RepID=A0ABT3A564_9ALTE|nr:hypothetical protein [Aestuariibacter sp. AA17]MCV2883815.1 hypothetical protein [Aestuariibacter sp. AA17]
MPPRIRHRSIKHENIDRQIRVLHHAMGKKILASPELQQQVIQKIEERYQMGKLRHGHYLTWLTLMEATDDASLFMTTLLDDSPYMRKLRRFTPFVGVLTEEERQRVLMDFACGTLDDVII